MYHECSLGDGDRYYSPKYSVLYEDELLTIKATGYKDDETHRTRWMVVSPSDSEYDFWYWMACIEMPQELVQERELSKWKALYKTQTDLAGSETEWLDPSLKQSRKKAPVK
jgi:hypothetical protein